MPTDTKDMTNIDVCGKIDHLEARLDTFERNYRTDFDDLDAKLTKLYDKVYGNGEDGMTVTLATLSTKMDTLIKQMSENCLAIKELGKITPGSWLSKNWKTILFVATAFFLILHSIIPADVNLWTFFSKILGGP